MSVDTPSSGTFVIAEAKITVFLDDSWSHANIKWLEKALYDHSVVGRVDVNLADRTLCANRSEQLTLERERLRFVTTVTGFLTERIHLTEKELAVTGATQ